MAAALQGADAAMTRYTDAWGVNAVLGNDATFVDDVRALLGSDPSNATVLATLAAIYDLVLTNVPGAPASWTLSAAERDQLTRQRDTSRH